MKNEWIDEWILITAYSIDTCQETKESAVHKTAYNGFEITRYTDSHYGKYTGFSKSRSEVLYFNKYIGIETNSLKEIKEKIDSMY